MQKRLLMASGEAEGIFSNQDLIFPFFIFNIFPCKIICVHPRRSQGHLFNVNLNLFYSLYSIYFHAKKNLVMARGKAKGIFPYT